MNTLPVHLKTQLVHTLYHSTMKNLPFLVELDETMRGAAAIILPYLKPSLFDAGDLLVSPVSCFREVMFIVKGECRCINILTREEVTEYVDGDWFGEVNRMCVCAL